MTFLGPSVIFIFAAYFAILIGIAVVRSRRMREMQDYVLARRRLDAVTSALSASSSAVSSGSMLVVPALAFADGGAALWFAGCIFLGGATSWIMLARRLRRYTFAAGNSLTISEFLDKRFDDRTGLLRSLAAVVTLFFLIIYISSGLVGGSKLLQETFGLDPGAGIVVTLFAVASYTLVGGFLAVSRTDVFQSLLMLAALIIMTAMLLQATGNTVTGELFERSHFLNPFNDARGEPLSWVFVVSLPGWTAGAWGSLRVLQRYMAIRDEAKIPASRNVGIAWLFLITVFGLAIGWAARPMLEQAGLLAAAVADPEKVYFLVTEAFRHPFVSGVLLCGAVAAVMSTADSQLLLGSAVAAGDLPLLRRFTSSLRARSRIWFARLLLVVIGVVAMKMALYKPDSILDLVAYAFGGMGAAFGPCVILALYWRRFNRWGALSGMVAGTAVSSVWWFLSGGPGGMWDVTVGTPGFAAGLTASVIGTLMTAPPSAKVVALFDEVNPPTHPPLSSAAEGDRP